MIEHSKRITKILWLIQLLALSGCSHYIQCGNAKGAKEYEELDKYAVGQPEREQKFNSYPIEEQINIFLYARNCPDDPTIYSLFYKNGEERIPLIVERIQKEPAVWDKTYLLLSLMYINGDCGCIKENSEIVKKLEDVDRQLYNDNSRPNSDEYKKSFSNTLITFKEQLNNRAK